ncbi:hypothetical protein AMS68_004861 [Peltaster fructicola]|uniref:Protein BCP1 n=1 Tax=Peltaster fructicola TaxID=286661 RepID=A0A6H0XX85_9PEZI|nr:hypothetical protein AMS68_004861 [Peltaster fructicola]
MAKRKAEEAQSATKTMMEIDADDVGSDDDDSMINVDFEFFGLNPEVDFHGLKTLMKQLFDIDNELIELSQLADLILSQADHVGTGVKCDGEESDAYSFITVLNVSQHRDHAAIKPLLQYLDSRLTSNKEISSTLQPQTNIRLGLILSERLINMPHQVVPPMYNMLQKEMSLGGADFQFTHLLLISKTYTEVQSELDAKEDRPQKKARAGKSTELFYFHPEDEILLKHAIADQPFQYQKENEASSSDSRRAFQEEGLRPQGHAILLDAGKFNQAVQAVSEYLGSA